MVINLITHLQTTIIAKPLGLLVVKSSPLHVTLTSWPIKVRLIIHVHIVILVSLIPLSPSKSLIASITTITLSVRPLPWIVASIATTSTSVGLAVMSTTSIPIVSISSASSMMSIPKVPLRVVSLGMAVSHSGSIVLILTSGCGVLPELITDLATGPASAELTIWLEAIIPVHSDHAAIQDGSVENIDGECCLFSGCILHKTESTWLHLYLVEPHYQVDYLSTRGEEFE